MPGRGLRGAVLTALGAQDYTLTVVDREQVTSHISRLRLSAPRLLGEQVIGPAAWARLWFPHGARLTPRAFTLLRPDDEDGTVEVEFALHDGPASWWAHAARPGDEVTATLTGSASGAVLRLDRGSLLIGDPASLPAINSLLVAAGRPGPRTVLLECQYDDDRDAPVAAGPDTEVVWLEREPGGAALAGAVRALADRSDLDRAWVACEATTTRRVADVLHREIGVARDRTTTRGYWTER